MKTVQQLAAGLFVLLASTTAVHVKGAPVRTTSLTSQLSVPQNPADSTVPADAPVIFSDVVQSGTDIYTNGSSGVVSIFQSAGDWDLDTTSSAARTMWLDLAAPSLPFNAQYVHSWMITHCANNGLTPVGSLTGVGSSTTCPMTFRINWGTDGSFYRIGFNSIVRGTGDVKFTCNAVNSTNGCIDWTGVPADNDSMPGDGRSVGLLMKVTTAKGKEVETPMGYYSVAFRMHITKP